MSLGAERGAFLGSVGVNKGDCCDHRDASEFLAVEDIDRRSVLLPPSSAFDRYSEWCTAAHRGRGGPDDRAAAAANAHRAGIDNVARNVGQPAGLHGDITQIAPLTLANTRPAIVELGIASDGEIDEALAELDALAQEPATALSMPQIVQAWGTAAESATSVGTEAQGSRASDESLSGGSS